MPMPPELFNGFVKQGFAPFYGTMRLFLLIGMFTALLTVFTPTHAEPYVVHNDGQTVLDKATGLVWMRCSLGQTWDGKTCAGVAKEYTFDGAQQAAKDLNATGGMGGYTDWIVPTVRQLASLIYCSSGQMQDRVDLKDGRASIAHRCEGNYTRPVIQTMIFPNTLSNWYWTASPHVGGSNFAWDVDFGIGYVDLNFRDSYVRVRLVRATQLLDSAAALGFFTEAERKQALQPTLESTRARVLAVKGVTALWQVNPENAIVAVPAEEVKDKKFPEFFYDLVVYLVAQEESKTLPTPYLADVNTQQAPQAPAIAQAADLTKGEFETSAAFAQRQAAEKARVDDINQHRQVAYKQALSEYEQAVAAYNAAEVTRKKAYDQKLTVAEAANNNPEILRQRVQAAFSQAWAMWFGNPELKEISYDADKQVFSGKVIANRQPLFQIPFNYPVSLSEAPKAKEWLVSGYLSATVSVRWPDLGNSLPSIGLNTVRRDELFAKADTVEKLNAFIREYPSDDPVVKQAKEKIPVQLMADKVRQRKEYLIDYWEADAAISLRRFIDNYSDNDPYKLVPKARAKLSQLEAKERAKEKKRIAEQKAEEAREKAAEAKRLAYECSPAGRAAAARREREAREEVEKACEPY